MNPSVSRFKPAYRWFLLVAIIGVVLRFLLLAKESLWFDELYSWWLISGPLNRTLAGEPTNPPLFNLMLRGWMAVFGRSEAALRSLSAVASVGAIFVTYAIGRRICSDRVALLAAIYQALSAFHVFYAQEVRTYAVLLLVLSLAFLALVKGTAEYAEGRRLRFLLAYSFLAAASLYLHFIASFYLAMHGVYVLIRYRRNVRVILAYAVAGLGTCVLFSPWLVKMLQTSSSGPGQIRRHLLLKIPQTYLSFLFGDTLIPLDEYAVQHIRQTLVQYAPELILALLSTAAIFVFIVAAIRKAKPDCYIPLLLLGIGPVLLSFLVSFKIPLMDERYVIASTPFVYLGVALGVDRIWAGAQTRSRGGNVIAFSAVAIYTSMMVLSLWNYFETTRFGKEQWRDVMHHIDAYAEAEGAVLVFEPSYMRVGQDYYGTRPIPRLTIRDDERKRYLSSDEPLQAGLKPYVDIWLIRSHEPDDQLLAVFQRLLTQREHITYPKGHGIDVFRFSKVTPIDPR